MHEDKSWCKNNGFEGLWLYAIFRINSRINKFESSLYIIMVFWNYFLVKNRPVDLKICYRVLFQEKMFVNNIFVIWNLWRVQFIVLHFFQ